MQPKSPIELILTDDVEDDRLDQALAKLLPDYSRSQLQRWIEEGHVTLNHQPTKTKTRVRTGDVVILIPQSKPSLDNKPQAIALNIIHEDEAILILHKPAGMVVHPGAGNQENTMLNALLHHAPELKQLPRAGILHRLDKDTSGLLVVAKTEHALKSLSAQLKKKTMQREYQAIVYGSFISGGTIDAPIDRHHLQRKRMAVVETGKPAVTHYRIAEKFRAHTRLKLMLETGRTHQIRVHLTHIRHPIVGDPTYGARLHLAKNTTPELTSQLRGLKRQMLHAFALGFNHPLTNEPVRYEIDLPDDMKNLLIALRADTERNAE